MFIGTHLGLNIPVILGHAINLYFVKVILSYPECLVHKVPADTSLTVGDCFSADITEDRVVQ